MRHVYFIVSVCIVDFGGGCGRVCVLSRLSFAFCCGVERADMPNKVGIFAISGAVSPRRQKERDRADEGEWHGERGEAKLRFDTSNQNAIINSKIRQEHQVLSTSTSLRRNENCNVLFVFVRLGTQCTRRSTILFPAQIHK